MRGMSTRFRDDGDSKPQAVYTNIANVLSNFTYGFDVAWGEIDDLGAGEGWYETVRMEMYGGGRSNHNSNMAGMLENTIALCIREELGIPTRRKRKA